MEIDWQIVEKWATRIAAHDLADLRRVFGDKGARGPEIIWQPDPEQLFAPQLRFLHDYWSILAAARPMPIAWEIDPLEMKPALGYVMLVDLVRGGEDFRYRLYGSRVAAISGFDVTGRLVSEHPASAYIIEFTLALYRAALRRRLPVFSAHGPPATLHTAAWHRLVLPLADATGEVMRFLVGIVPIAYNGRPL